MLRMVRTVGANNRIGNLNMNLGYIEPKLRLGLHDVRASRLCLAGGATSQDANVPV